MRRMHWERIAQHLHLQVCSKKEAIRVFRAIVKQEPAPKWVTIKYGWKWPWPNEGENKPTKVRLSKKRMDVKKAQWQVQLKKYEDRFVRWATEGPPKSRVFPKAKLAIVNGILKKYMFAELD